MAVISINLIHLWLDFFQTVPIRTMPIDTDTPTLLCDGLLTNKVTTEEINIDGDPSVRTIANVVFKHVNNTPANWQYLGDVPPSPPSTNGPFNWESHAKTTSIKVVDMGGVIFFKINEINMPQIPDGRADDASRALVAKFPLSTLLSPRTGTVRPGQTRYGGVGYFPWTGELAGGTFNYADTGKMHQLGYVNISCKPEGGQEMLFIELWFNQFDYENAAGSKIALDDHGARIPAFTVFLNPY